MNIPIKVIELDLITLVKKVILIVMGVILGFTFSPVEAAETVTWKASLWGNRRAFTEGVETIKEEVAKKSGGNFKIKLYYGEALSKSGENLDGLYLDAFQMTLLCSGFYPKKAPTLTTPELPAIGLEDLDMANEVYNAYIKHPAVVKDLARWNAKILMWNSLPRQEIFGNGKPPIEISDWKGRSVVTIGMPGKLMKNLGAVPTSIPVPEVYTLLSRGTVSATALPFSYTFRSFKIDEVTNWYTSNMALSYPSCHVAVSKRAFDKLPEEYKNMLTDAIGPAYQSLKKFYSDVDAEYIPFLKEKGFTEIVYSDKQLDEIRKIAGKPIWNQWLKDSEKKAFRLANCSTTF
jgi:TRAP-type C4-dicarboxylate transport system substrate-binding protein